jgi:uncharacterized protein with HEPN domain
VRSDEERLLDIIDESGLVLKYVPTSREKFNADEVVQAALTRWLQNIDLSVGGPARPTYPR